MIYRLEQRAGIALHAINRVAMHGCKRRLAISFEELADTNDYIEWSPQFMAHGFGKIRCAPILIDHIVIKKRTVPWDID